MSGSSPSSSRRPTVPRPTAEQAAIIEAVSTGQPLRVLALAGTGKTTTLQLASQALPGRRVLYLAFNRSVAEEARARFPRHVEARTAHSLAFAAVGRSYGARLVASPFAIRQAWPRWADARLRAQGLDRSQGLAIVTQTLTAFLHTTTTQPGPGHVPPVAFAGRDPADRAAAVDAVVDLTRYFWREAQDPTSPCPVTHDVYLKRWQLSRPTLPYDVILLDEAQDADPVLLDVLRHQSAQLVLVGDPHQAIYGWRGARDALAGWRGATLPLTHSWRFGPEIAEAANAVLTRLGAPYPLVGAGPGSPPHGPAAYIARTTLGLLGEAVRVMERRTPVALLGGAEPVAGLLEAAHTLQGGRVPRHPDLALFEDWADLQAASETPAGAEYRPLVEYIQQQRDRVPRVVRQLRTETVEPPAAEVVLTTCHKAKGREWSTVTCASDFRWPRYADDREEAHLLYVALTRARHVLRADAARRTIERGRPLRELPPRSYKPKV